MSKAKRQVELNIREREMREQHLADQELERKIKLHGTWEREFQRKQDAFVAKNLARQQEHEMKVARQVLLAGRKEELRQLLEGEQGMYVAELAAKGLAISDDN